MESELWQAVLVIAALGTALGAALSGAGKLLAFRKDPAWSGWSAHQVGKLIEHLGPMVAAFITGGAIVGYVLAQ
jgi:hypothetical protein